MESQQQYLFTVSSLFYFLLLIIITISCSVSSVLFYLVLRSKLCCSCHICAAYLASSWSSDFDNLCDWYTHLLRKSPSQTIHIHVLGNIITSNPENVESILKTNFQNYPKGKSFSTILADLLGNGIFNVDGEMWRFQRKMASLELATNSIRSYAFQLVTNEIKSRLIPILSSASKNNTTSSDGGLVDLQDVFRRFSFDNICKLSFGLDPGCLESSLPVSLFADSFDLATKLSAQRAMETIPLVWKVKRFFKIGNEKKLKDVIKIVNIFAYEVIARKRSEFDSSKHNKDLLSRFMACVKDDDEFLRDIVISFILAGRDTMASALTALFYLLPNHPQVVSKIRDEFWSQDQESYPRFGSYEHVKGLHYLQAAVYESLRLYPPVQFDSKFARDDDLLPDGTFVRKGTRVTYHPYAMGRMESIWGADCMEFKPERWIKNGTFCSPRNPFEYPVFQAGIRVCLGKELSIVEMKVVAVHLLQNFDIKVVAPAGAPRFTPGLTATISGGLQATIRERTVHRLRTNIGPS